MAPLTNRGGDELNPQILLISSSQPAERWRHFQRQQHRSVNVGYIHLSYSQQLSSQESVFEIYLPLGDFLSSGLGLRGGEFFCWILESDLWPSEII